jgi:amidohydrolase
MLNNETFVIDRSISQLAFSFQDDLIKIRREFHQIPEASWKETKTIEHILLYLQSFKLHSKYKYEIKENNGGIYVDLEIDESLPWILFRADIDGLPIVEETNLSFSSKHPGFMHACGHDCHTAILIIALKAITLNLVTPKSNIRFVWQRAEECGKIPSGGYLICKEGILNNISKVYGLHISSTLENGVFSSRKNIMMANSSYIEFTIHCSGGHVMRPDLGSNAISLMSDLLSHLKGFEKLFFGPDEPIAFVPSIARAGDTSNIRPNSAYFCFAIRNFLQKEKLDAFAKAIRQKIETITKLYPTAELSDFQFHSGYPSLANDPENYEFVKQLLEVEGFTTNESPLMFSGEDFSYYLNEIEGSFWCLGAKKEPVYDHHTSKFDPDESSLWQGVAFWLGIAKANH